MSNFRENTSLRILSWEELVIFVDELSLKIKKPKSILPMSQEAIIPSYLLAKRLNCPVSFDKDGLTFDLFDTTGTEVCLFYVERQYERPTSQKLTYIDTVFEDQIVIFPWSRK